MPTPYQNSALRQFDNDPDDDVADPESSLNMMVEDSTSDDEEIIGASRNHTITSSKTIGAIDADAVSKLRNILLQLAQALI